MHAACLRTFYFIENAQEVWFDVLLTPIDNSIFGRASLNQMCEPALTHLSSCDLFFLKALDSSLLVTGCLGVMALLIMRVCVRNRHAYLGTDCQ